MLKFSKANAKIENLGKVESLQKFLSGKRKVYSLDLLSGWSCFGANECLSKVHIINDKRKVIDGPNCKYRCFSCSQEALFTPVYNSRKHNFDTLRELKTTQAMASAIIESLPLNSGIIRFCVGGDIFNQAYFDAIILAANSCQSVLFYLYTKSIPLWIKRINDIPENLILTASYGGRYDDLIEKHNLRYAKVVFSEKEAEDLKLEIDHDDSAAADPSKKNKSLALLIHGVQPKHSRAGEALKLLKKNNVQHSYSR